MGKIFLDTRNFLDGKIDYNKYINLIYNAYLQVENKISGEYNALSFAESAKKGILEIKYTEGEENALRKKALICDIFNNLAHALQSKNKRQPSIEIMDSCKEYFGMKPGMIMQIIKECKKVGNNAYGLAKDKEGKNLFVVDIPMYGQISWHLLPEHGIISKDYEFTSEKKRSRKT